MRTTGQPNSSFQRDRYVKAVAYLFDAAPKAPAPTKEEIHGHCAGCISARKKIRGSEILLSCRQYGVCTPGCIDKH